MNESLDQRLASADARFERVTRRDSECVWGADVAQENGWSAQVEWWYWCVPLIPGEELAEELGLAGPSDDL